MTHFPSAIPARFGRPVLCRIMATTALATVAMAAPSAFAQQVTVASGPTTAGTAASGATVVAIADPNAAGVSHNRYTTYDVGTPGQVLNNNAGADPVATQLAGDVGRNANLTGAAKVILNEVVGGGRSTLNGLIEVAGTRADVIVANRYGISCTGCGFVNTDRAVLTTGTPVLTATGALQGFTVRGGDVAIAGGGLNAATVGVLDILSRRVRLAGPVRGNVVNVVAGANTVDYASGAATAIAGDAAAEGGVAIDSSALGGMYANRIRLVATDRGVGVAMNGDAAANAGEFSLAANGTITVGGTITAAGPVRISTTGADADIRFAGATVTSRDALSVAAGGDLAIDTAATTARTPRTYVATDAGGRTVTGTQVRTVTGHAGSVVTADGDLSLASGGALTIAGSRAAAGGRATATAGGGFALIARQDETRDVTTEITGGDVAGAGTTGQRTAVTTITNTTGKAASLTGGAGSAVSAGGDLLVQGSSTNAGLKSRGRLSVLDGQDVEARDTMVTLLAYNRVIAGATPGVTVTGPTTGGTELSPLFEAGGTMEGQISGGIDLIDATVTRDARTVSRSVASSVTSTGNLTLDGARGVTVRGSTLAADGDLLLTGGTVDVLAGTDRDETVQTQSRTRLGLSGDGRMLATGKVALNGAVELPPEPKTLVDVVRLLQGTDLKVTFQGEGDAQGRASVEGDAFFGVRHDFATAGTTATVQRGATLHADRDLTVNTGGQARFVAGTLDAGRNLAVRAAGIDSRAALDTTTERTSAGALVAGVRLAGKGAIDGTAKARGDAVLSFAPAIDGKLEIGGSASGELTAGLVYQGDTTITTATRTTARGNTLTAGDGITRAATLAIRDEATRATAGGAIRQTALAIIDRPAASDETDATVRTVQDLSLGGVTGAAGAGSIRASVALDGSGTLVPTGSGAGPTGVRVAATTTVDHGGSARSTAVVGSYAAGGDIASTGTATVTLAGTRLDAGKAITLRGPVVTYDAAYDTNAAWNGRHLLDAAVLYPAVGTPDGSIAYQGSDTRTDGATAVAGIASAKGNLAVNGGIATTLVGTTLTSDGDVAVSGLAVTLAAAADRTATTEIGATAGLGWNRDLPVSALPAGGATIPIDLGALPVKFAVGGKVGSDVTTTYRGGTIAAGGKATVSSRVTLLSDHQVTTGATVSSGGRIVGLADSSGRQTYAAQAGIDNQGVAYDTAGLDAVIDAFKAIMPPKG